MNNNLVRLWALFLICLGLAIAGYKYYSIGFPLSQQKNTPVWTVQAQVSFIGNGGPAKIKLDLPKKTPGFYTIDEDYISSRYGLTVQDEAEIRRANWAVRRARGEQRLYYRISIAKDDKAFTWKARPEFPTVPDYQEPYGAAVRAILEDVRTASADIVSFTRELLSELNAGTPNENIELIQDRARNMDEWTTEIIEILKGVRIPARRIWGFNVNQAANDLVLTPKLQVHNGSQWVTFNAKTGAEGIPENFLVWKVGDKPRVSVSGGREVSIQYSVTRSYANLIDIIRKANKHEDSMFIKYSLLSLPIQIQNTYQLLLMIPLGALIVAFMRTYVGLNTFGTFMPVLIAISFRETQLFWGLIAFTLIVTVGLLIRFYFERLMLLLVPRLAAILIVVVMLMLFVSMVTSRFEVDRLISVSLFPMVILAMMIERMSIVWEENGFKTAFYQGLGSLVTAVLGYLVMTHEWMSYLMFVFPELLLSILGICIWMGKYTGYRLAELFRFRDIAALNNQFPAKGLIERPGKLERQDDNA